MTTSTAIKKTGLKKSLITLIMLFVMLAALFPSKAFAANVCQEISGDGNTVKTFTVHTGSRWLFSDRITFTQEKGLMDYSDLSDNRKNSLMYGYFKIRYRSTCLGDEWKTVDFHDHKTTVKLESNRTYKFEITPLSVSDIKLEKANLFNLFHYYYGWIYPARWKVSSTKGIEDCVLTEG